MLNRRRNRRSGSVALEFAVTLPLVICIALSAFDIVNAVTAWRRLRAAATATAEIATALAVTSNGTVVNNVLDSSQTNEASTAIFAYMPALRAATIPFSVTLSSVFFTPQAVGTTCGATCVCLHTTSASSGAGISKSIAPQIGGTTTATTTTTSNGTSTSVTMQCYVAATAWSSPLPASYAGALQSARVCNTPLTPTVSNAASLTTLPEGVYGPFSLLIADLSYKFTPTFLGYIMGGITFRETAYVPPRIGTPGAGTYVQYSPTTAYPPICTNVTEPGPQ